MNKPKKLNTDVTEKDLADMLDQLMDKNPRLKQNIEDEARFLELISPYMKMTKEEMEKAIPDGAYNISSNGFVCITGKGGFINVLLQCQKNLNSNE